MSSPQSVTSTIILSYTQHSSLCRMYLLWHLCFVFAAGVHAGSRSWQPPIRRSPDSYATIDDLATGRDNKTDSLTAAKRWITIKPGDNDADVKLWPNREITYCFADTDAETATFNDLREAQQLWHNSGLSENFKWTRGSASVCAGDRSKYLRIEFDANGELGTTVGLPALREETNVAGPTMRLSNSLLKGHRNVVVNYAHVRLPYDTTPKPS